MNQEEPSTQDRHQRFADSLFDTSWDGWDKPLFDESNNSTLDTTADLIGNILRNLERPVQSSPRSSTQAHRDCKKTDAVSEKSGDAVQKVGPPHSPAVSDSTSNCPNCHATVPAVPPLAAVRVEGGMNLWMACGMTCGMA
ncbi:hypothetical protein OS493_023309 [Desmophyllum pertusum]|uniref:Uncharacterized protein n=1 Tax=Desmophyllum pertusum TaxID=174260 RepID=A0A9X0CFH3_9CNID|nr:hypothetical protein OS493_023309 [Desmophyllum pertusum]